MPHVPPRHHVDALWEFGCKRAGLVLLAEIFETIWMDTTHLFDVAKFFCFWERIQNLWIQFYLLITQFLEIGEFCRISVPYWIYLIRILRGLQSLLAQVMMHDRSTMMKNAGI